MHQHTIMGADYGVAEGEAEQMAEGAGSVKIKVLILTDPHSGEIFQFPLLAEKADDLANQILTAGDPQPEPPKSSDLVIPGRPPSETELRQMHEAASGRVVAPDRPMLSRDPRAGKPVGGE